MIKRTNAVRTLLVCLLAIGILFGCAACAAVPGKQTEATEAPSETAAAETVPVTEPETTAPSAASETEPVTEAPAEEVPTETEAAPVEEVPAETETAPVEEPADEPEPILEFTVFASNQVVDCGTVDVTAFMKDVKAAFGSEEVADIRILGMDYQGNGILDGFDAVDMSKPGFYRVAYGAEHNGLTIAAAFTVVAMADNSTIANGGFEAGNLAGWTVLTEGWSMEDGQYTGVVGGNSYWDEKLPFNNAGDFHLDGWNTGIAENESWAIRSTVFTLGGSGYISVRMGGAAAAVKVFTADGNLVGYYRQTRFHDAEFPHIRKGGSWADMGTYVMDLTAYIGQELYIELWDEQVESSFSHAFFDEVVTFYADAPNIERSDLVMDGHSEGEKTVPTSIPWQLAENLA